MATDEDVSREVEWEEVEFDGVDHCNSGSEGTEGREEGVAVRGFLEKGSHSFSYSSSMLYDLCNE